MKKFRWTMILSIIMLLISCGNGGEKPAAGGEAPAGGEAKKEIKIGVALYKFDDTFISSVKDAINEISDEKSKETCNGDFDLYRNVNLDFCILGMLVVCIFVWGASDD